MHIKFYNTVYSDITVNTKSVFNTFSSLYLFRTRLSVKIGIASHQVVRRTLGAKDLDIRLLQHPVKYANSFNLLIHERENRERGIRVFYSSVIIGHRKRGGFCIKHSSARANGHSLAGHC